MITLKIIKGWVFSCKECGGHHLVPADILSQKPETLKIKCPHSEEDFVHEYEKTCFSGYSGFWTGEIIEKQNII